jgi:type III secretion protein C
MKRRSFAAGVTAAWVLMAHKPVLGADVPWRKSNFTYLTRGESLRDFFRQFGASQGLTVVVDPAVEDSLVGNFNMSPQNMMETLAIQHGLIWYYDGSVMHIYLASQAVSKTIRLNYGTVSQLRQTLTRLNIVDKRYPLTYDVQTNTAIVSGPKRMVELIEQMARGVDQAEASNGKDDIQVFALKYAPAADQFVTQGGKEYRIPGVASTLRSLYQTNGSGARHMANGGSRRGNTTLEKLRGLGLASQGKDADNTPGLSKDSVDLAQATMPAGLPQDQQVGLPQFTPDVRTNAVVVRDTPERMAFYERVIRQLDIRPSLVEIEARIIEVSADKAKSLGVDWRVQTPRFDAQSGMQPLTPDTALGRTTVVPITAGGVFATRLVDAGRQLMARVNALAKQGHAMVTSTPRIMALDNIEAVIESNSEFNVRVAGNLDVDLFAISAGTSLRIAPLIVPEGDRTLIKLVIRIQDGTITNQQVDAIPVVRRTNIGTQTIIGDGESLLIAGFTQTTESTAEAGVPGASSVPIFGRLFKYEEKKKQRVERMFLLTPRVVPLPGDLGR